MAGFWRELKYIVPNEVSMAELKQYVALRITNGLATGPVPNDLTGLAPFYGVTGSINFAAFRGKEIVYFREWEVIGDVN